ncbi:hypothetical protein ACFSYJ_42640, partial [Amycolatopsis samaneae]
MNALRVRRIMVVFLAFAVFAGLIQPSAVMAAPAPVARVAVEDPVSRPMPPDPYREWDGSVGVPDWGDPRFRQIVVDNAELAEDPEVREAAAAALAAGGSGPLMEFLNHGLDDAKKRATARKTEQASRDLAAVRALRGTGGPVFNAEVERVLAG